MSRAQCIVHRESSLLLVRHRQHGMSWWCLPGGAVDPGETVEAAALRELREECGVRGRIIRRTSWYLDPFGGETVTFLVDIGEQRPRLGHDPEFAADKQILIDVKWLDLEDVPERDRAFLWAAGLLGIERFLHEVAAWGDHLSYPGED